MAAVPDEGRYLDEYFRLDKMPHIWCPGCGHGIVTRAIVRAIDKVGLEKDKTVVISGIGCSGRTPGYLDFNTLHTTHGRAIAFATGVKLANPELNVIVVTGDGDAAAIGGNHLIHACRRNIDITVICYENSTYGMTGGQSSPMTPFERLGTTAPYGSVERSFDLCRLTAAAGATYVARGTAYHVSLLINYITKALQHKGFSFVEATSQCPTYYGRKNRMGDGTEMLKWQKENAVTIKKAEKMSPEELREKIIIGEFLVSEAPEFTSEYQKVIQKASERRAAR